MNRRQFLATSPAFLAALALGAKAAGALPVGFPREPKQWHYFEFLALDGYGETEGYCTTTIGKIYKSDGSVRRVNRKRYEELMDYFRQD